MYIALMLAEVNFLALTTGEVLMPSLKLPKLSSTTLLPSAMLAEISVIRALKSGVKKCPNLFRLYGFAIRSKGVCFSFYWGITNPPVL